MVVVVVVGGGGSSSSSSSNIKTINTYVTPVLTFKLRNSKMDTYRLREPPKQNENVTHKI